MITLYMEHKFLIQGENVCWDNGKQCINITSKLLEWDLLQMMKMDRLYCHKVTGIVILGNFIIHGGWMKTELLVSVLALSL